MRKSTGALGASLFVALSNGCSAAPPERPAIATSVTAPNCAAFWQRMSSHLPGSWSAQLPNGKQLTESFSLVSNESVLVEDFVPPNGRKTVSVYHPDQQSLMLTHYCGQGNQPRLRAAEVNADSIVLRFLDATNVSGDASVLVEKRLHFIDADAFDQTEIYRGANGELEETVFHFKRSAPTKGNAAD
ncbi:MAG: hypothetical protein H6718_16835 [Polyangiaceae bacterium]|nr:hypothetical protein [Myxococcales bacterium]MCB9587068.1 hypothetical protein [Polyangiaceae bacterium]